MLTKTKAALAAALVVGAGCFGAASALASDNNSGQYSGGFVVRGSSAVNSAYHPRWNTRGTDSFAYVASHANTLRTAPAGHEGNYGSEAGKEYR
jgi:hypothetical protein